MMILCFVEVKSVTAVLVAKILVIKNLWNSTNCETHNSFFLNEGGLLSCFIAAGEVMLLLSKS